MKRILVGFLFLMTSIPVGHAAQDPVQLDAEEQLFFERINAHRRQNGKQELKLSSTLTAAAQWMARDMVVNDNCEHEDSLGRDPFQRLTDFGYGRYVNGRRAIRGENIYCGSSLADDAFRGFLSSTGHNENMLDPAFRVIGIGRYRDPARGFGWATDFGSREE